MRNYVLAENRPYTVCPIWKKDLRKLMIDFCIPEPTIDQIILRPNRKRNQQKQLDRFITVHGRNSVNIC